MKQRINRFDNDIENKIKLSLSSIELPQEVLTVQIATGKNSNVKIGDFTNVLRIITDNIDEKQIYDFEILNDANDSLNEDEFDILLY